MSNPISGLSPLTLVTPAIAVGATTLSIDCSLLPLSILADSNTVAIDITLAGLTTTLTAYAVSGNNNLFTGALAAPTVQSLMTLTGRNYLDIDYSPNPQITPTLSISVLPVISDYSLVLGPPTGVTVAKSALNAKVEWATPTTPGLQGVLVEWSTDRTGVTVPYQQFDVPIKEVSRVASVAINIDTKTQTGTTSTAFSTNVATTTTTTVNVNYSSVTLPSTLTASSSFYVRLSTIIQDPSTNLIYQSQYAGPILAGFVDLRKVTPSDFPELQRAADIAGRLITNTTRRLPILDLTAHSEVRDAIINPVSLELANMSVRAWFGNCCRSIEALSQIDDANGDGISDPVSTSTVKQQILQAYGLTPTSVQSFLDTRFDILGASQGVTRGGATTATIGLTLFTYSRPSSQISLPLGITATTEVSAETDTASFTTTAAGAIAPVASYDPVNGWWAVTLPAECTMAGSLGAVGEGSVSHLVSGSLSGLSVINLLPSVGGTDKQSNSDYAAAIMDYAITGRDSSSRGGYRRAARAIPGITACQVVGAGDLEMQRDWDPIRQKHVNGCVDLYVQGNTSAQQTELVPFLWPSTSIHGNLATYVPLVLTDVTNLRFSVGGFNPQTPLYTVVEVVATNVSGTLYLGSCNAQIDNINGVIALDPQEFTYQLHADGTSEVYMVGTSQVTNLQLIQSLASQGNTKFQMMARIRSNFVHTPALQPVTAVGALAGPVTLAVPSSLISLSRTRDFLLEGGSTAAGDTVVASNTPTLIQQSIYFQAGQVTCPLSNNMSVPVGAGAVLGNIVSLRASDLSTLYVYGEDYTIIPTPLAFSANGGRYGAYALSILKDSTTNLPRIGPGWLVAAYYQYPISEHISTQTDTLSLSGSTAVALSEAGFVKNTWLPASYGMTSLLLDGYNADPTQATGLMGAGVPDNARYIKVVHNTTVMLDEIDFSLRVDVQTGAATVARTVGGRIPDGGTVTVTYFYGEVFSLSTEYPTYVQQLTTALADTKAASADILVKAQLSSPVDVTMVVELDAATLPSTVDARIRTTIAQVLNQASSKLTQVALASAVYALSGVTNVQTPLLKCAKSDGSFSIAEVIPTNTSWTPLYADTVFAGLTVPVRSFITSLPVLANPTIPSGGQPTDFVGLLHQGTAYRRALSVQDFLASTIPSFYIIGSNDSLSALHPMPSTYTGKLLVTIPQTSQTPSFLSFFATYVIYGATGATDVICGPMEKLTPGTIAVQYVESE